MNIGGAVLDASAISQAAVPGTYAGDLVDSALEIGRVLVVPASALAEAWQKAHEDDEVLLAMIPDLPVAVVDVLDTPAAIDIGHGARIPTRRGDLVYPLGLVHAVHVARIRGWPLITGHPHEAQGLAHDLVVEEI